MKKIILTLLLLLLIPILFSIPALAQTKATTPTNTVTQQQIDELKSKIASKVAELNLVEKRGVLGIVSDISDTQITLVNVNGEIKNIDVDELTKFYSSNKTSFGISDIKNGQTLGVLGLYNKDSRRILAREINDLSPLPKIEIGIISKIDKINYEVTLTKSDKTKSIYEIEDTTKTYLFSNGNLQKSGFSKLTEGQTIVATGITDPGFKNKILTSRIIVLSNVDSTGFIKIQNDSIPATGSAVKK